MTDVALTRRQADTLRAIREYREEHGCSPTFRELGAVLGISKVAAWGHVQDLAKAGVVQQVRPKGFQRGWVPVENGATNG